MAKFELKFLDQIQEEEKTIKVFFNPKENTSYNNDSIRIWIDDLGSGVSTCFDMDKSTAIKFAKTLRTEINKITESEVNNG
jgi:hypothetical protein